MATEEKKYLVNVESNLDKYAKDAAKAREEVERLTLENMKMQASDKATTAEKEKTSAALRNAQKEYRDAKKAVDLQTQANNSNINSRKQLNAIVTLEQKRLDALANTYTINEKGVRVLSQAYINQVKALSQAKGAVIAYDQAQKDGRTNVGRYSQSIGGMAKNLMSTLGIYASVAMAARAFFNVIKNGLKTTFNFEYAMSQVKAITRATSDEFDRLRSNAISLGGSTKFTATEVAGLQKEYAKLGFTTNEILAITAATLDLAAAVGTDISTASKVAGATMRQFNLDASEMGRVVDVMAMSFSTSALDITKFEIAMAKAGPVAAAVGDDIEDATNKLGFLADAGLDASTAGTSLRNIYLELAKSGLTWDQAMNKIQGSQSKASTALALFGKRGAVAGLILADNNDIMEESANRLRDIEGAAKDMAGVMLDNVQGSVIILKSAWEGFILRLNKSTGALKSFLSGLTAIVTYINTTGKPAVDRMFDVRTIETFGDKFRFYGDQGIGFWNALGNAAFRSKKQTQEYSDSMSSVMEIEKKKEDDLLKIKLKAEAEEKRIATEKLQRQQAEVEAAEKATIAAVKAKEDAVKAMEASKKGMEKEIENLQKLINNDLLGSKTRKQIKLDELKFNEDVQKGNEAIIRDGINADNLATEIWITNRDRAADALGALSSVLGEETTAGKFFAAAQATINTWVGASLALRDPTMPSTFARIAAMVTIILSGLATVKNILKVDTSGKGTPSISAPTSITSTPAAQRTFASPVASSFFTQPQLTQQQLNVAPQNLLTAADIANAISKLPTPIVTVEAYENVAKAKTKVEIRAVI